MHTKKEEEKRFVISDSQAEPDTLTLSTLEFYIYIRICHGIKPVPWFWSQDLFLCMNKCEETQLDMCTLCDKKSI